ncbi:hypothetical protein POAR111328_07570 [Polynucleobacter arcticus]
MDHRADQITQLWAAQAIDLLSYFVENCSQPRKYPTALDAPQTYEMSLAPTF